MKQPLGMDVADKLSKIMSLSGDRACGCGRVDHCYELYVTLII